MVLAAALGDDELTSAIGGTAVATPRASTVSAVDVPAMFLGEIAVEGFRGIAGHARLGLRPGPGLTLVVGRNGSGKSSFAEAAELALTGTASRWEKRSKVWEEGWACLHHDGPRTIELRLLTEGVAGETVVRRQWAAGDPLNKGTAIAQAPGDTQKELASLGLGSALSTWRPFLSYNELGGLLDEGPSRLYDAISAVLGLEEWVETGARLTQAVKGLTTSMRSAKTEADRLRTLVSNSDDERAKAAVVALRARKPWDLDALEALATGAIPPRAELAALEGVAALRSVDLDATDTCVAALRQAIEVTDALVGTDADRARELADLLEQALTVHGHAASATCPVCATPEALGGTWVTRTTAEVGRLRAEASAVSAARVELRSSVRRCARAACRTPGPLVDIGAGRGYGTGVRVMATLVRRSRRRFRPR